MEPDEIVVDVLGLTVVVVVGFLGLAAVVVVDLLGLEPVVVEVSGLNKVG